jgi:hypothetical protein
VSCCCLEWGCQHSYFSKRGNLLARTPSSIFSVAGLFLVSSTSLSSLSLVGYNLERCAWWEAAILCRKLLLQCVVVLVSDLFVQGTGFLSILICGNPLRAVSLGNWIVAVALFLQLQFRPYDRNDMNQLDIIVLCVIYVRLLYQCVLKL